GYNTNEVPVINPVLGNLYSAHYKIINESNFLIDGLEAGQAIGLSEKRRDEMISEAKFQRAFANFNLLRYFGQFYDLNSNLGIVLRSEFSIELVSAPRNTVQEVYDFIKEDLEYAVANGPTFIDHYYSGSLAAKALLSKVELYTGNYDLAAILASEVINNSEGYVLEAQFGDIFVNSFNSSEVIFAPLSGPIPEGGSNMGLINNTVYSETLRATADVQVGTINDGSLSGVGSNYDPRFSYAYSDVTKGSNNQGKYPFQGLSGDQGNTLYHLRLAEIFLVHAEAEARRLGGDLDASLSSLNVIRNRAGVDPKDLSDIPTLLEDIRQEKLLELFFENGEPWFDMVRFDVLGNSDASSIKPTIVSDNQFILPIPQDVLTGNPNVLPNPGY
ncbi:MAG: RagB/SusD family nutrient uptake outer membrane protein, partial [Gelidibacter sp.]